MSELRSSGIENVFVFYLSRLVLRMVPMGTCCVAIMYNNDYF